MRKTFESWSKDKKKKVYEDEEWGYDEEGNSLNPKGEEELPDPAADALYEEGKVWFDKVIALMQVSDEDNRALTILQHLESLGEYVEEKSFEHVKFSFPTGFSEGSVGEVTEQDFGDQGQLGRDIEKATSTSDKRSDRVAGRTSSVMKLQDILVTQVKKIMASATKVGEKELTLVLRKMLKNVDQLVPQQGGGEEVQEMTGEEEYEEPEVAKAAEKARLAKIDSVKAQLKALQKQR